MLIYDADGSRGWGERAVKKMDEILMSLFPNLPGSQPRGTEGRPSDVPSCSQECLELRDRGALAEGDVMSQVLPSGAPSGGCKDQGRHKIWTFSYLPWQCLGFLGSSTGKKKKSACNEGDPGLIPELGRSAGEGIGYPPQYSWASLVAQTVKNLPEIRETWVRSLGWEDALEEGMATHSSVTWRIPLDRGVWWATVHGVSKSLIPLSD